MNAWQIGVLKISRQEPILNSVVQEVAPSRTDIKTWADLQDVDDKLSFE